MKQSFSGCCQVEVNQGRFEEMVGLGQLISGPFLPSQNDSVIIDHYQPMGLSLPKLDNTRPSIMIGCGRPFNVAQRCTEEMGIALEEHVDSHRCHARTAIA
jgi:hypothetical protein